MDSDVSKKQRPWSSSTVRQRHPQNYNTNNTSSSQDSYVYRKREQAWDGRFHLYSMPTYQGPSKEELNNIENLYKNNSVPQKRSLSRAASQANVVLDRLPTTSSSTNNNNNLNYNINPSSVQQFQESILNKSENVPELYERCMRRIEKQWQELKISEEQQNKFRIQYSNFTPKIPDKNALYRLTSELQKWTHLKQLTIYILQLIDQRETYIRSLEAFCQNQVKLFQNDLDTLMTCLRIVSLDLVEHIAKHNQVHQDGIFVWRSEDYLKKMQLDLNFFISSSLLPSHICNQMANPLLLEWNQASQSESRPTKKHSAVEQLEQNPFKQRLYEAHFYILFPNSTTQDKLLLNRPTSAVDGKLRREQQKASIERLSAPFKRFIAPVQPPSPPQASKAKTKLKDAIKWASADNSPEKPQQQQQQIHQHQEQPQKNETTTHDSNQKPSSQNSSPERHTPVPILKLSPIKKKIHAEDAPMSHFEEKKVKIVDENVEKTTVSEEPKAKQQEEVSIIASIPIIQEPLVEKMETQKLEQTIAETALVNQQYTLSPQPSSRVEGSQTSELSVDLLYTPKDANSVPQFEESQQQVSEPAQVEVQYQHQQLGDIQKEEQQEEEHEQEQDFVINVNSNAQTAEPTPREPNIQEQIDLTTEDEQVEKPLVEEINTEDLSTYAAKEHTETIETDALSEAKEESHNVIDTNLEISSSTPKMEDDSVIEWTTQTSTEPPVETATNDENNQEVQQDNQSHGSEIWNDLEPNSVRAVSECEKEVEEYSKEEQILEGGKKEEEEVREVSDERRDEESSNEEPKHEVPVVSELHIDLYMDKAVADDKNEESFIESFEEEGLDENFEVVVESQSNPVTDRTQISTEEPPASIEEQYEEPSFKSEETGEVFTTEEIKHEEDKKGSKITLDEPNFDSLETEPAQQQEIYQEEDNFVVESSAFDGTKESETALTSKDEAELFDENFIEPELQVVTETEIAPTTEISKITEESEAISSESVAQIEEFKAESEKVDTKTVETLVENINTHESTASEFLEEDKQTHDIYSEVNEVIEKSAFEETEVISYNISSKENLNMDAFVETKESVSQETEAVEVAQDGLDIKSEVVPHEKEITAVVKENSAETNLIDENQELTNTETLIATEDPTQGQEEVVSTSKIEEEELNVENVKYAVEEESLIEQVSRVESLAVPHTESSTESSSDESSQVSVEPAIVETIDVNEDMQQNSTTIHNDSLTTEEPQLSSATEERAASSTETTSNEQNTQVEVTEDSKVQQEALKPEELPSNIDEVQVSHNEVEITETVEQSTTVGGKSAQDITHYNQTIIEEEATNLTQPKEAVTQQEAMHEDQYDTITGEAKEQFEEFDELLQPFDELQPSPIEHNETQEENSNQATVDEESSGVLNTSHIDDDDILL